jgi:hypothetical protein
MSPDESETFEGMPRLCFPFYGIKICLMGADIHAILRKIIVYFLTVSLEKQKIWRFSAENCL